MPELPTREQIEQAFLAVCELGLPAFPGKGELEAMFQTALETAQARFAGELLEAWREDRGDPPARLTQGA